MKEEETLLKQMMLLRQSKESGVVDLRELIYVYKTCVSASIGLTSWPYLATPKMETLAKGWMCCTMILFGLKSHRTLSIQENASPMMPHRNLYH